MKKFCFFIVLFFSAATGLSSCNSSEDDYYRTFEDELVHHVWTGDIGLYADNGETIFSSFRFGNDGFGTETQYYTRDGMFYNEFRFSWRRTSGYSNDFLLDYGRFGISYMEDLDIYSWSMTGVYYLTENSRGFRFRLERD